MAWLVTLVGVSGTLVVPVLADLDVDASFAFDEIDLGGTREAEESLGEAMAVGDFDGDGYDDLAVGLAGQALMEGSSAPGAVRVIAGSIGGPLLDQATLLTMDVLWGAGTGRAGDGFGFAIAAGDFNGDGYDDLAVGVPDEGNQQAEQIGIVHIINGSPTQGLTAEGNRVIKQAGPVRGSPEEFDQFGAALASGDFDGDGDDDLAIGAPFETVGHPRGQTDASGPLLGEGTVTLLRGGPNGLERTTTQVPTKKGPIPGKAREADEFGRTLASGDINHDGRDDLAIGTAGGPGTNPGEVIVVFGSAQGITTRAAARYGQRGPIPGKSETFDRFGWSIAIGDFSGDAMAGIAIGVPGEDRGTIPNVGRVVIVPGR